jgi:DNA-binding MarR family transcriptional regulator
MDRSIIDWSIKIRPMPDNSTPARFYEAGQYPPEQSVGYLLNKVLSSILSQADSRLAAYKLTYAQWVPLFKLFKEDGCTPIAMARDLSVDPAALTRSLTRLETKGLLRRERSTQDRRVVHLRLTDEGRAVAEHVPGVLAEVLNAHLSGFSHDEWQLLLGLLSRMLANGEALKATMANTPDTPTSDAP